MVTSAWQTKVLQKLFLLIEVSYFGKFEAMGKTGQPFYFTRHLLPAIGIQNERQDVDNRHYSARTENLLPVQWDRTATMKLTTFKIEKPLNGNEIVLYSPCCSPWQELSN